MDSLSIPTVRPPSRIRAPNVYTTDHQHSRIVCHAFAQGCGGRIVSALGFKSGSPAAMYGILRGTGEIIRECRRRKYHYWYIDHGYFAPGHYDGHYRVIRDALQARPEDFDPDTSSAKWTKLYIEPQPWKRDGRNVVFLPLSDFVADFYGLNGWNESCLKGLHEVTDRPIYVKQKGEGDLDEALKNAWCVVTHSSNAAIDSIIRGVPAIVLGPSAAIPVARTSLDDIEHLVYPEREPWCHWLANHQWTLDQMRSGEAWAALSR